MALERIKKILMCIITFIRIFKIFVTQYRSDFIHEISLLILFYWWLFSYLSLIWAHNKKPIPASYQGTTCETFTNNQEYIFQQTLLPVRIIAVPS